MKKNFLSAAVIASLIAVTSCKKSANETGVRASEFWANHQVAAQSFSGNANTGFTVTGAKGTKLNFPASAFVDASGNVISGNVTVTLKEVLSKKDVLLSGVFTEASGQLLESAGEIEVKARQGNNELQINPALAAAGTGIGVEVPKVMNDKDMGLFVPKRQQGGGGAGGGQNQQNPDTWAPAPYYPFGNGPNSYTFNLPGFTWVNCDRFYNDPNPKTTVTASPDFQDNNQVTDMQVMLVCRNITTVVTFPFNYQIQKFESYSNSLPIGLQAEMVIIGKDSDGFIQFATQPVTITANMHVNMPIHKATQGEVDAYLATIQ
jgi:hypothetical protein